MVSPKVDVFFYGSFINIAVLARGGLTVDRVAVAKAWGFDIRISTLATLVRSDQHCVYGIACKATHAELDRLYGQPWLNGAYRPEAIMIEMGESQLAPALCYIANARPPARPAEDYVNWIMTAASELGLPAWYIARLQKATR